MGSHNLNKKSWESLSSTFSNLEISLSRDSCYASDEVSITSKPATANTSMNSITLVPLAETTLRPLLKPILKRPYSEIQEDVNSESGYASDASGYEHEAIFEETDGDMCDIPDWDDTDIMSEYCEDDIESIDGSFISFESIVRFDSNVRYIDSSDPQEDESDDSGMTCHEMMEMARSSTNPNKILEEKYSVPDVNEVVDSNHEAISDSIEQLPEHTGDIVDLDKRLFVAYMNGINGIENPGYRLRLRARVADFKSGNVPSPFLDLDSASGIYLDQVLSHVIGTFRNIVIKEEFDELVSLSDRKSQRERISRSPDPVVFSRIEHLLFERLSDEVSIGPDELGFFASGVAYALENWRCYAPS